MIQANLLAYVKFIYDTKLLTGPVSVVGNASDCRSRGRERSHTFMEIDHEIISTVILLLRLIQGGLLSVTSESMCTKYWLTAYSSLPNCKTKCAKVN